VNLPPSIASASACVVPPDPCVGAAPGAGTRVRIGILCRRPWTQQVGTFTFIGCQAADGVNDPPGPLVSCQVPPTPGAPWPARSVRVAARPNGFPTPTALSELPSDLIDTYGAAVLLSARWLLMPMGPRLTLMASVLGGSVTATFVFSVAEPECGGLPQYTFISTAGCSARLNLLTVVEPTVACVDTFMLFELVQACGPGLPDTPAPCMDAYVMSKCTACTTGACACAVAKVVAPTPPTLGQNSI
jgi:hypothetical protein